MADPLSLLRTYAINKKEIIERDDEIILGEFAWSKHVKTNFVMCGSDRNSAPKDYYTLESLVLFLKNSEISHTIYVRHAAAREITPVRRPDRKNLLAYLHGTILTCASIDQSVPFILPNKAKRGPDCNGENGKNVKKLKLEEWDIQKVKEQLAARLEAPKEGSVFVNSIKSLSDTMSVEKIAEIKAKRLANKKTIITDNDDFVEKKHSIKVLLDSDVDVTKDILSRERQWRNRLTILQTNEKKFDTSIFAMLNRLKIREEQSQLTNRSIYNRYDQERFDQKQETAGFQIDTTGSYHGRALKTVSKEGGIEFKVADVPPLNTPLQSANLTKRVSRTPIIIIPSAPTSLISLFNVKDILQDFKFVTTKQKKKECLRTSNSEAVLQRQRILYRVIDNPLRLTRDEWDRVVAVFVLGPTWQFKSFPWPNPVEVFSKICAFHIKYDEVQLDPNVGRWAVTVINLSRTRRYLDRAALKIFWEKLDSYITTSKPHFLRI